MTLKTALATQFVSLGPNRPTNIASSSDCNNPRQLHSVNIQYRFCSCTPLVPRSLWSQGRIESLNRRYCESELKRCQAERGPSPSLSVG